MEIRINLLMSGGGFYFRFENQGSKICMGCMEDGWSVWVGCEHWEMTALFAGFERRCIHEGKEGKEAVVFGDLQRKLKRS